MNKLFYMLFGIVLTGLVIAPNAAFAASVTVAVKQANTSGPAQTVTCSLLQKNCDLPFTINAGQSSQQTVTIHAVYTKGTVVFSFQAPNGYYYARNMNAKITTYTLLLNASLQGGAPATYSIGLFQPLAQSPFVPENNTAHTSVASLLITATPSP